MDPEYDTDSDSWEETEEETYDTYYDSWEDTEEEIFEIFEYYDSWEEEDYTWSYE